MTEETTIRRTVNVKLELSEDVRTLLEETISQYRWAANHVVSTAWPQDRNQPRSLDSHQLHKETYEPIRTHTSLHASHVQLARDRAIEAMTSVGQLRSDGRAAGRPTFSSDFLDFNGKCATIAADHAELATVDGRVECRFCLPEDTNTPHHRYLTDETFQPVRSTLTPRDDDDYLHVGLQGTREQSSFDPETPGILGVDLGVSNLAVTSTGRFWSGDEITHLRDEYQRRRRSLQRCGSRWAHENIQSLSRRFRNRIRTKLHTVANELVTEAVATDCPVIAIEELAYVYESIQQWQNIRTWAYGKMVELLSYKAEMEGITVTRVDPETTSRRCSTCGYTDAANRQHQAEFECQDCGYQNHADYNAAKNIGLKLLRRRQTGGDGGAPVGVRVNSGIITHSGHQQLSSENTGTDPR